MPFFIRFFSSLWAIIYGLYFVVISLIFFDEFFLKRLKDKKKVALKAGMISFAYHFLSHCLGIIGLLVIIYYYPYFQSVTAFSSLIAFGVYLFVALVVFGLFVGLEYYLFRNLRIDKEQSRKLAIIYGVMAFPYYFMF